MIRIVFWLVTYLLMMGLAITSDKSEIENGFFLKIFRHRNTRWNTNERKNAYEI